MVTTMRTVRVSWLLLLALALGAVVARPAAADDRSVDVGVENFQHTCHDGGGTLDESHYEFNTDGSVRFATVRCKGGDYDGWSCDIFPGPTPTQCSRVFDPGTGGWRVTANDGAGVVAQNTAPDPTVDQTVVYWDGGTAGVFEAAEGPAAAETPEPGVTPEDEPSQAATRIRHRFDAEDERP
jgi:hypothetical protein